MGDTKSSLHVVMKGRDEGATAMLEKFKGSVTAILGGFGVGYALAASVRAAGAAMNLAYAGAAVQAARAKGEVLGLLEAQKKYKAEVGEMLAAVPVLGQVMSKAWREVSGEEVLSKQIDKLKEFKKQLADVQKLAAERGERAAVRLARATLPAEEAKAVEDGLARQKEAREIDEKEKEMAASIELKRERQKQVDLLRYRVEATRERRWIAEGKEWWQRSPLEVTRERRAEKQAIEDLADAEKALAEATADAAKGTTALNDLRAASYDQVAASVAEDMARMEKEQAEEVKGYEEELAKKREAERQWAADAKSLQEMVADTRRTGLERELAAVDRHLESMREKYRGDAAQLVNIAQAAEAQKDVVRKKYADEQAEQRRKLEDEVFEATHTREENERRGIERWAEERKKVFQDDYAAQAMIEDARLAKLRATKAEEQAIERGVSATSYRFLRQIPGMMERPVAPVPARQDVIRGVIPGLREAMAAMRQPQQQWREIMPQAGAGVDQMVVAQAKQTDRLIDALGKMADRFSSSLGRQLQVTEIN